MVHLRTCTLQHTLYRVATTTAAAAATAVEAIIMSKNLHMNIELDLELFSYLSRGISFMGFLQFFLLHSVHLLHSDFSFFVVLFHSIGLRGCAAAMVLWSPHTMVAAIQWTIIVAHRCLKNIMTNARMRLHSLASTAIVVWIILKLLNV